MGAIAKDDLLNSLPQEDTAGADKLLQTALKDFNKKIIVLDDDPTGTQTVFGISVYTTWDVAALRQAFDESQQMFYILTNSRSLTRVDTIALHKTIAQNIAQVSQEKATDFIIVSRSDSTLRGHYPTETLTLKNELEAHTDKHFDGEIIMPFFLEGGRYTINDIHYVADGNQLIPAGETEFAQDRTFGYHNSNLKLWVEEKTKGAYPANAVQSITIPEERQLDLAKITANLMTVTDFNKVIVNTASYGDAKVAVAAIVTAMNQGKNFMFRTAAAFTKLVGGIPDKPLLTRQDITDTTVTNGGLIIVGSHVQKTTDQLKSLQELPNLISIQFDTNLVVEPAKMQIEFQRVLDFTEKNLKAGHNVVVYTNRKRLDLGPGRQEEELQLSVKISNYVTQIVEQLQVKPSFIIAKGGITSSDVATKGLGIKRAQVAGQVQPGIPVWLTGPETKFPNIAYVIFPGNVGAEDTLKKVVAQLS
ncbi:MAG: hydroxyacid dehydrogenase [Lactobacillus sp.]|jgi:uncharacterized protein YgbK (DUF1537 family)|nr:hydroxyacid dehydrogenase [Lactobacillus sp.]